MSGLPTITLVVKVSHTNLLPRIIESQLVEYFWKVYSNYNQTNKYSQPNFLQAYTFLLSNSYLCIRCTSQWHPPSPYPKRWSDWQRLQWKGVSRIFHHFSLPVQFWRCCCYRRTNRDLLLAPSWISTGSLEILQKQFLPPNITPFWKFQEKWVEIVEPSQFPRGKFAWIECVVHGDKFKDKGSEGRSKFKIITFRINIFQNYC